MRTRLRRRLAYRRCVCVFLNSSCLTAVLVVSQKLKLFDGRKASLSLNIIVIGCGLGGLAAAQTLAHAGHKVTIVEGAPAIGEIGAGIQVTPNLSRLLIRWGLGEQLKQIAVKPEAIALRRCEYLRCGWLRLLTHGAQGTLASSLAGRNGGITWIEITGRHTTTYTYVLFSCALPESNAPRSAPTSTASSSTSPRR